ncbi:glycine cleavage system protein R [Alkalilimnicola ehrlichii]|uniref:Glycine cleavage system transcriptional repressor n=1 Tax=Alkalilimnicola ehrlichii TaxID=351052 RepID=A0A3E0WJC5_9GAMM|nr:glycine cleavage system protein R [Alkalilimnicola ehrlichii]RFA24809.1 glycine cleavage system protein R [Alkalilimnicola ehrlichii]RFA32066.1 glycine cleavage system protein R [Alkalilimnicola ehrlichii]
MQNLLVVTALGEDRPGIVDELSRVIVDSGCNIENSRMTVLGSDFAVIMLVSGRWNELAKLESSLPQAGRRLGLLLNTKRTDAPTRRGDLLAYAVEVISVDHPGIVHQLSNFFAKRSINIRDLSTASYAAAHTGTPMFSVLMTIDVPANTHIATLREEFMDFCDRLNLDAIMEPVKS